MIDTIDCLALLDSRNFVLFCVVLFLYSLFIVPFLMLIEYGIVISILMSIPAETVDSAHVAHPRCQSMNIGAMTTIGLHAKEASMKAFATSMSESRWKVPSLRLQIVAVIIQRSIGKVRWR